MESVPSRDLVPYYRKDWVEQEAMLTSHFCLSHTFLGKESGIDKRKAEVTR